MGGVFTLIAAVTAQAIADARKICLGEEPCVDCLEQCREGNCWWPWTYIRSEWVDWLGGVVGLEDWVLQRRLEKEILRCGNR